jgi:hypothetical protein
MKRLHLGFFAISTLLAAGVAEAHSYNCADHANRPDSEWSLDQPLSMQVVTDLVTQHLGAPKHFKYRFCGVTEDGEQLVMIGAFEIVDGTPKCDSSANFGEFYDPRKRSFTDAVTGIDMCTSTPPKTAP